MAKVYRNLYSESSQGHSELTELNELLPGFFHRSSILDVTEKYVPVSDINISITDGYTSSETYLAVFNNENWIPIGSGVVSNGKAFYKKVGRDVVYLPILINRHKFVYSSYPFLLDTRGYTTILKPNMNKTQSVFLSRKYPLAERIEMFLERMVGGRFQVSNDATFEKAVCISTIETRPEPYFQEVNIKLKSSYRYVRYLSPLNSYGNIAELEFYENQNHLLHLDGKVIGTEGSYQNNSIRKKESVFDQNPLTFFDSHGADSSWVGLDLGKPKRISKIRFLPRTDYNIIVKGNEYELLYWDSKWISLGKQIANSNILKYDNVPTNALFLLHNHTGGFEERIFTYENGKQVWW